jgi:hypothetical protein
MEHVVTTVEMRDAYGTSFRTVSDRLLMARVGFDVRGELRGFLKK